MVGALEFESKTEAAARRFAKKHSALTDAYVDAQLRRIQVALVEITATEKLPSWLTLTTFYTELGQSTELKSLGDMFEHPKGLLYVLTYSENDRLLAVLRGARDASDASREGGVVYDVAVRSTCRRYGLARRMISRLPGGKQAWGGNPARVIPDLDRGLTSIRTIYGISLTLGFQEVARGLYVAGSVLRTEHLHEVGMLGFVALTLALLGSRIYWAAGVIRRFVLRRVLKLDPPRRRRVVLLHYPALFMHAVGFFWLCSSFKSMACAVSNEYAAGTMERSVCFSQGGLEQHAPFFIWLYVALLIFNALWLLSLNWDSMGKQDARGGAEVIWIVNNWAFAFAAMVVVGLASSYGWTEQSQVIAACALFFANSIFDIAKTSWAYSWNDAFSSG